MPETPEQVKRLIRRWERGQGAKAQWMTHWDDIARVQNPRREGFVTEQVEGSRRTDDLFDSSPQIAARGLANAVGGMIRPEGHQWIKLRVEDDRINQSEEAKDWLADREQRLFNAMYAPTARLRQATGEVDLDLVTLGTGLIYTGESRRRDSLLYQSLWIKDAVPLFNDEGQVDGMLIKRKLTTRDMIERFGGEQALSEALRQKLTGSERDITLDQKQDLLHAVVMRDEGRPDALLAKNLPFADYWIEFDTKHQLANGGFHEFPFAVPRWDTSSGEDFGRSPGMVALPDCDTAQAVSKTLLIAGQRAAAPPLAVPSDSTFNEYNTFPDGLIYYDPEAAAAVRGNPIFPLPSGANMPLTLEIQQNIRDTIFAAFFRNVLNLPIQGPQMTATEVIQRKEEFIREVGPVFGRLETDYTANYTERSFNILLRAGVMDPIPEILQGQNIVFVYESPVKRIRQQVEAAAAHMWVLELLEIAAVKPEALDLVDVDEYARFTAEANGLPRSLIPPRDAVDAIRQQRAQKEQQARQLMEYQSMAETTDKGASAITKLMPQQQGA